MNNIKMATPVMDVAINIFAKPYQTALTILSLLRYSKQHINSFWLQFEPLGSKFDKISSYYIAQYLTEELDFPCNIYQPEIWLARKALSRAELQDPKLKNSIRYQAAFELSKAEFLFITHNDVLFMADLPDALLKNIDGAFAIGDLGQCTNCPAHNEEISQKIMGRPVCTPETYQDYTPTHKQLCNLYKEAAANNIFVRPYGKNNFEDEFKDQPWPLPECRVNEWACLINLKKIKNLSVPYEKIWPFGAFKLCNNHNLDIAVAWFRDLHKLGLFAKHFNIKKYLKHWVGTGNKSQARYTYSEERAKSILEKNYPDYINWLNSKLEKNNG